MPAISPRTMSFSGGSMSQDQARPLFEQGFSQMAYDVLVAKLPMLSPDVVTFRIIDVDPQAGNGSGTFVVRRGGQTIYIPVVMADNQVKPLDIMYFKAMNVFLPLSRDWVAEVDKNSLSEMGAGRRPPPSLSKDMDIRQVVVPPVTGRFSYAEDASDVKQAGIVFDQARNHSQEQAPAFLEYLKAAPSHVKKAAALVFESRPKLLKKAAYYYGTAALVDALRAPTEKTADFKGGVKKSGGALYVADANTAPSVFKDVFGPQAPMAFQEAVTRGYAAKDERKALRAALRYQPYMTLTEPGEAGAYSFVTTAGKQVKALAFPSTIRLFSFDRPKYDARHSGARRGYGDARFSDRLAITTDGDLVIGKLPAGEKIELGALSDTSIGKALAGDGAPKVGKTGVFVRVDARGMSVTEPVKIKSVSTDSQGVRRVVVTGASMYSADERTLITTPDDRGGALLLPKHDSVGHMPKSFKFVSYDTKVDSVDKKFVSDHRTLKRMVTDELVKSAAEQFVVRHGVHGWTLGESNREGLKFAQAVEAVARTAHIPVESAAVLVKSAQETGHAEFWAVSEAGAAGLDGFLKRAAGEQMPVDPSQMQSAAPSMPAPVDMAVAEQTQNIMNQMQALQQQLQMLQMVQQRSQQIAQGGGAAGAPAAAAAAMGGPMPMGGAPVPGMPGMDPSQGQMPQEQQIDPQTGQPVQPPPAMMSTEPGSPEELAAQVNPQFMDQAAALDDEGVFDAAALASLAQSPSVRDLVHAYIPNLERALDNLGRVLLTLYLDESHIKDSIGTESFLGLEDNIRSTFKGLGDLLLKINQSAGLMRAPSEQG